MLYHSTRNRSLTANSAEAVLEGLAPDGGLYMPQALPAFDAKACLEGDFYAMATALLGAFLPDIPHMEDLVRKAYTGKFETEDLTPTVAVGDLHVLELFHGPTAAFKDVALSILPRLMSCAMEKEGKEEEIRAAATKIFKAVDGQGLSRVDFFLEHETNRVVFNEINTLPGFTSISMYPKMWNNMGKSTTELLDDLIAFAETAGK